MATLVKLPSGNWRVQIRRKGRYAAKTFSTKEDAENWGTLLEREIDGKVTSQLGWANRTLGDLIDLYLQDMMEARKRVSRTRALFLESIRPKLGRLRVAELTRANLIKYGRSRALAGAAPATVLFEMSNIGTILSHAEAIHGASVSLRDFALARKALRALGVARRSRVRSRRPSAHEIECLIEHFVNSPRQVLPMDRIVQFAIATALRRGEIFRLEWSDVDMRKRIMTIRNRKAPYDQDGNHEVIPMLNVTGFDAWQLLLEQRIVTRGRGRVFPYCAESVGVAFARACAVLNIKNLRFHDLRRESATRLFEAGLSIEKVALVTGHKSWDMLRRYTQLRAEDLVRTEPPSQLSAADFIDQLLDS